MEELLLRRLKLRRDRLVTGVGVIETECAAGVDMTSLSGHIMELKNFIDALDAETRHYLDKTQAPDQGTVDDCLDQQIKAEDLLVELQKCATSKPYYHNVTTTASTKLPKMELPKFDGSQIQWCEFWDKFESNVHNKNLPDVEKLSYLLSCLQGAASKAVAGLSTTAANYDVAVKILLRRFGSCSLQIDSHYTALSNLPRALDSTESCRITLDSVEHHLRVLETLGEPGEGNHLRAMVLSKFPEKILREHHLMGEENDDTMVTIRKNLNRIVSAMEKSSVLQLEVKEPDSVPAPSTTDALHVKAVPVTSNSRTNRNHNLRQAQKRKGSQNNENRVNKKPRYGRSCEFCYGKHYSDQCQKFNTLKERKMQLQNKCYLCFASGHVVKSCKLRKKCVYCSKRHHRALCHLKIDGKADTAAKKGPENQGNLHGDNVYDKGVCVRSLATTYTLSFLQTAVALVNKKSCRLLLDSGSQRSYISSRMAQTLGLTPHKKDLLLVYTFGANEPKEMISPSAEVTLETKRGTTRTIQVNVVPRITERVPVATIGKGAVDFMADDDSVGEAIDMLIGNDFYFSFITGEPIKIKEHVYLVNSEFGWLVSGHTVNKREENALSVVTYCQCHQPACPYFTEPDLPLRDIDMRFMWALESIGIGDSPKSTREEEAVKHFNETTRYVDGRYEVKWPWVQYPPHIPTNYGLAYGRLKGILRKLDQKTLTDYNTILQEQLAAGVIEIVEPKQVQSCQATPPIHYLPHHMVKQSGKKGRLVYDASAKLKGEKSLNECMYSGPSMLEDLTALLVKFRMGKIGITADIEKAFLQVALQKEDRDVTRFLWVKDPSKALTDDNLINLRFCRVPFGIISSPFLLTATIRFHMARTDGRLLSQIADKCYVDNLILAVETKEEAMQIYEDARQVFGEISMNIRDWTSNSLDLMQAIPKDQQAARAETVKVLGLRWNLNEDCLTLNLDNVTERLADGVVTKKEVLRTTARLYDPCGFASPAILEAKLVFQELCIRKLKWNEPLPDDMLQKWMSALENLMSAKNVTIPRYVGNNFTNANTKYELHCFCDASKDAYAAVTYLRIISKETITTAFIMSKARVTPVEDRNDLKIPRLELLAYLIGNRLLLYVKANVNLTFSRQVLWTDSEVVLAWMKSNKLLPPFVQRRVNEIKLNKEIELRHVNTKQNPADVATRPDLWQQKSELWFQGPPFLVQPDDAWPQIKQVDVERVLCSAEEALDIIDGPEMIEKGYEQSWDNVNYEMEMDSPEPDFEFEMPSPVVTVESEHEDIGEIKKLQAEYFPGEVSGQETSLKRNLGIFMDVDGLLRCEGRMTNTSWSYDMKHPILIPKECAFTKKVIEKTHEDNYHVGVSHTLSLLRRKYWIPQGRAQVKKTLKACAKCIKHGGGPYKLPPAPALPSERVNYSTPFTYVGVDYMGPLYVTTSSGKQKRWICLFTCLAVRAVHLEVVNDLTAEESFLALRRFIAARGLPKKIVSDNALYFKLVSEVLAKPYCKENSIRWKFIPSLAPWHGAIYERLVALVKHCLKRTVDKHLLNDHQLLTVVKEVETVINSRPLTCVGAELEQVLTPLDFLSFRNCLVPIPSHQTTGMETSTKIDLIGSWRKGLIILKEFKKMFTNQYLTSLRERYGHSYRQPRVKSSRMPRLGDVVQIKDDSKNRNVWKVGRISSLFKGTDGQCRVAKVKVGNAEFTRSLGHLYPLEADIEGVVPEVPVVENKQPSEQPLLEEDVEKRRLHDEQPEDLGETSLNRQTDTLEMEVEESAKSLEEAVMPPGEVIQSPSEGQSEECVQTMREGSEVQAPRSRRVAAIRAREKIAEWTQQLVALL